MLLMKMLKFRIKGFDSSMQSANVTSIKAHPREARMVAKALQVPRGVGFRVFGYDCGFSPLFASSLLVFFNCEKRALRSKYFLPKRRNVTPRRRTAHAKRLRIPLPFSHKYPRFFARFRPSGKKGSRGTLCFARIYISARATAHICMHYVCDKIE